MGSHNYPQCLHTQTTFFRSEIMCHTSCLPSWGHATTLNSCTHKPHFLGQKSRDTQVVCLHRAKQLPSMPAHTNLFFWSEIFSFFVRNHVTHKLPAFMVPSNHPQCLHAQTTFVWSEIMSHTSGLPSWCRVQLLFIAFI